MIRALQYFEKKSWYNDITRFVYTPWTKSWYNDHTLHNCSQSFSVALRPQRPYGLLATDHCPCRCPLSWPLSLQLTTVLAADHCPCSWPLSFALTTVLAADYCPCRWPLFFPLTTVLAANRCTQFGCCCLRLTFTDPYLVRSGFLSSL